VARVLVNHLHKGEMPGGCLALVVVANQELLQLAQRRQFKPEARETQPQRY